VAANAEAAICAARGFGGISVLNRGTEAARLRDLPLTVLSPPPEILETFERWGIRTLGAFAKLPAVQVSERLGQEGVKLHKLAQGTGVRPLVPHAGAVRFVEVMELDYEITTIEPLTFILSRMLDGICARMRSRNLATHEVRLALGAYTRVLNLPLPVRNPRLLTKLLILDLEAHPPGAPIRRVEVEAIPANPRTVQNGLFVPLSPEPEKLELTLARLKAVVGEENVGAPEVLDTHRPDAFQMKQFGISRGLNGLNGFILSVTLRLLRPALEATVQLRSGIPTWIAFYGVHGPIATASGPWHTSGDWWRPHMWDREEWDIEVADALYRIYYDVHLDRWYAQGVYD
jgi:protein ImuB